MARTNPQAKKQEDINSIVLPKGMTVSGEIKPQETDEERRHRLRKEVWSFWVKEASAYLVALVIVAAAAAYCFWALWSPRSTREDRQWVMSTLASLLVGVVGYVFGKVTK